MSFILCNTCNVTYFYKQNMSYVNNNCFWCNISIVDTNTIVQMAKERSFGYRFDDSVELSIDESTRSNLILQTPIDNNLSDNNNMLLEIKQNLDKIFSNEINTKNVEECCICFDNIDKTKNNCITECGHTFCFKCLATSLVNNNNSCPYCRTKIVDIPNNNDDEDDEDDEDDDYDDDDDDYDDDDDDVDNIKCSVEEITNRLVSNGFTMIDMVSMLIGRFSKEEKYTSEYINKMDDIFNTIIDEADNEANEQKLFSIEDLRI
jgi:hypothetical protein